MISKEPKHQKHAKLAKPDLGFFGRNEWAIIGTPCGEIQQLSKTLISRLSGDFSVGYVDADHAHADDDIPDLPSTMDAGGRIEYTDKIHYHQFNTTEGFDSYQYRQYFNGADLVLVNGNHFKAKAQIVVIDPKKEDSLKRKLDRLTNVELILLQDGQTEIYPFLKDHLDQWGNIPVYSVKHLDKIESFLRSQLTPPPVKGLVLAGGLSKRMGTDKGLMNYHGKPQREVVGGLLKPFCKEVFWSVRPYQEREEHPEFRFILDVFTGLGPYGAILSAFRSDPNAAWLVAACDLPLLDHGALDQLTAGRNPSKVATAFQSPENEFPEPLITIWEPRSYPVLFQFLAQGYSCPRKVLINSPIELIEAKNPGALKNVNTREEADEVRKLILRSRS